MAEPGLDFVARATGYVAVIADTGVEIGLEGGDTPIAMNLMNAATRPPSAASSESAVVFDDLYSGIDVVYSANRAELEYSFVVDPGGEPSHITLAFDGAAVSVTGRGDLLLDSTSGPNLLSTAPFTYQDIDGERVAVASAYDIRPDGTVGFTVGDFDPTRPLVIDPTFVAVNSVVGLIPDGGTLAVPVPAGVTAGDVLIAQIGYSATVGSTITPTAGWTVIDIEENPSHDIIQGLYWRVATASEPAQYGFTLSSGIAETATGAIAAYSDVDTTNPIDAFAGQSNGTSTSLVAPSITTTRANTTLVAFFTNRSNAFVDPPAGMTERWDIGTTAGVGDPSETAAEVADETLGAVGPTGTRTATTTASDGSVGHLVAIAPAVCIDSDSDGLCDREEDANTDADSNPATNPGPDTDGDTTPNYLDADDDGDGTPTASENPDPNGDGDPRDALDVDRDGQADYLDVPTTASLGTVQSEQKISDTTGGFGGTFNDNEQLGRSVGSIGDVDGDGVVDVVVGAPNNDDGGIDRGAVYVMFMNTDGTVRTEQKISDTTGGLTAPLNDGNQFGYGTAGIGDVDGDGIGDIAVGSPNDADGGGGNGAVYVLFLNADGTVKAEQKISDTAGGLTASLFGDAFGWAVAGVGDIDGDGIGDLAVGTPFSGSGGAAYVLLLNTDGTVKAEQKIADSLGGLTAPIGPSGFFGFSVGGLGDIDGDGVADLAVGNIFDNDGGSGRGAVHILFLNTDGTVKAEQKISDTAGGLTSPLADNDHFGYSAAGVGDVDGDGRPDMVVGSNGDDSGGTDRGSVFVLYLNGDGTARAEAKISDTVGGLTAALGDSDFFGDAVAGLGDLDGDGAIDLAVAAPFDDDGGADRGAFYVINLAANGCAVDSDGDGLYDCEEDANNDADADPATNPGPDTDGDTLPNYLDADDDGDGTPTASENADPNSDGDPRDAVDVDLDGQPDYLDAPTGASDGTVGDEQRIDATVGGLAANLIDSDFFGSGAVSIGDLDGDGVVDVVVGASGDDDGQVDAGATYVLFLNADGTVKAEQKISDTQGGLTATLDSGDAFGTSVASLGDLDGDGINDVAVGASTDDDGVANSGAIYILFLNADGTVKAEQKISDTQGGLTTALGGADRFGTSVAGLGDLDGDGIIDVGVGAIWDDDGVAGSGAVYVLFLNADGTVKAEQKISNTAGGLVASLATEAFGSALAGTGDIDGDGTGDVVVGAYTNDEGTTDGGAVYVLFLNADGTVKAEQKINNVAGGLSASLAANDWFGLGASGLGDVDLDGTPDIAVGAIGDDDGTAGAGAVYVLFLNSDGTVKAEQKISSTEGNLSEVLESGGQFGATVSGLGDLDGDGTIGLIVGARYRNGAGSNRGAVYVLNLAPMNDVAQANPDSVSVAGDRSTEVAPVDNDIDADDDLISVIDVSDPTNGSAVVSNGTTVTYTPNPAYVGADSFNYWAMDAGTGLTHYWGLAGDGVDAVGTSDGVLTGTSTTLGGFGDGLYFDEIDDRVAVPDFAYGSELTLSFEFKLDDNTGSLFQYAYSHGDINDVNSINVFFLEGAHGTDPNVLRTVARDGDDTLDNTALQTDIASFVGDGLWHNYVLSSGSTNGLTVWIDGVAAAADPTRGTGGIDPSGSAHFGARQDLDPDRLYGGGLDTVQVYGRALSPTEISDLASNANQNTVSLTVTPCSDSDSDGLCDADEDANSDADNDPATNPGPNTDGDGLVNYLDADDDNDGTPTASENADPNGDGYSRDALDSDRDGQPDYLDEPTTATEPFVATEQKISDTQGGLTAVLDDFDEFGRTMDSIGDLDGDGVVDLAVGMWSDDDGGSNRGAVYVLFLNADGTVKAEQKISDTVGGLTATLDDLDTFGHGVAAVGDVDGDGIMDLAVGSHGDDDGGTDRGAVYLLFLNADGTVRAEQKVSETQGGLGATLDDGDRLGHSLSAIGDVNDDGVPDLVALAYGDDDGGSERGAVYVLFLNTDGTVKGEQKISDTVGGLTATLDDFDIFGFSLGGPGDIDGDGIEDLLVGALDDDDGTNRGAVYVLFLNADGTVKAEQKISDAVGGLTKSLDDGDVFGYAVAGIGDLDLDGVPDAVVGARSGDSDRGAIYVLLLNGDGTVKEEQEIADSTGGFSISLDDFDGFGSAVTGLGDLDGDGTIGLAVGAPTDDDGGADRGAVYILDLSVGPCGIVDSDSDGLLDCEEDANSDLDDDPATTPGPNTDGDAFPDYLDADDDGDGTPTASENADPNGDGDPRDALDVDRDGQPDYLDAPTGASDGTVLAEQKISSIAGGLTGPLDDQDNFGVSVTSVGDVDGDGIVDVVVGARSDDDGGPDRGAVYVLLLNADGTVKAEQKISSTVGGLSGPLDDGDFFGHSVSGVGDLDGDGIADVGVASLSDDDGGSSRGAVYVLFLNADGTVKAEQRISSTVGGLSGPLDDADFFGISVSGVGDLDGDGIADIAVGVERDDDGGPDRGAAYVLFLNADGTVKAEQKISSTAGGLVGPLDDADNFGWSVSGVGDLDGDGIADIAVGAYGDDDGGSSRGAVYVLLLNADGTVKAEQKISSTVGGLSGPLDDSDRFGQSVSGVGDVDGDGIADIAVGAYFDDDGATNRGAAYVLLLNADGTVKAEQKISSTAGGLVGPLDDSGRFGSSVSGVGDLDGDGSLDLAIGASVDDDGGSSRGAVYILNLAAAGCTVDSDSDGLLDCEEDANTDADFDAATNPGPNADGDALPNYLDADDDGDGTPTVSESADPNGDGDPRDATDTDTDREPDYLDAPTVPTALVSSTEQKISSTDGGLVGPLDGSDQFGTSATSLGDIDGDGVVDMAVGAHLDDDGGPSRGAVYVLFLNADGTVKAEQKISDTDGGLVTTLDDVDYFGGAVAGLGDLDGDGVPDLAVGAYFDGDGGSRRGAVYILFLNADGTVKAEQKISDLVGGLAAFLEDDDKFGSDLGGLGDVDGDGIPDLAVGADGDDDGASNQGAVHVLFLRADGTVKAEQKISATDGGFTGPLDSNDHFGAAVTGLGDLDGDGTPDLAIGAYFDGDGGSTRGAVYVLALNADGTVKTEQKISSTQGGLTAPLADTDWFGITVSGLGDLDGDGTPDLAVGAYLADDGGSNRGRVHLLLLNADGTVADDAVLSSTSVPLVAGLDDNDHFGSAVAGLGDLDGDGTIGLAVGARGDDEGAMYVFDLERYLLPLEVNSTGDAGDLAPGDGICDTGGTNAIALAECTLRAAIEEANASGSSSVLFDIPFADTGQVGGVWTITPATSFDDIAVPVVIDGSTHPSWVATPVIQIDGTSMGASDGLHLVATADGSTIRSLAIGNVQWNVIDSRADNTVIVGNHLGVDAAGTTQVPLGSAAVVYIEGSANLVGGSTASDRNLIAGGDNGVVVSGGAADTTISGNYIGTDISGNVDFGQSIDGIRVENGVVRTTVGGPTPAHGNVITSAGQDAVEVNGESADGASIQNNVMGIGADGTTQLRLGRNGIYIAGGADDIDVIDNVIGNTNDGIDIGGATTNTRIQGNTIGTNTGMTFNHDVSLAGIRVTDGATGIEIGGTGPGEGNHLALGQFGSSSIEIESAFTDDVSILGNTITNLFGAIDLGADGPTPNDPFDADGGPNDLKNYPTLAITNTTGAGPYAVDLDVSLDSTAGNYRVEIFANTVSGYGGIGRAGQLVHAFTIAHTGSGVETFATSYTDTSFSFLSATATEDFGGGLFGSTSEMSPAGDVAPVFVVNSTADTADTDESTFACNTGGLNSEGDAECTLRAALQQANLASTPTIEFNIPVSDPGYDADGYWTISKTLLFPDVFSNGLTIDGSTQPGFDTTRPIVVIDSNLAGGDLFDVVGDDVTLRSLALLEPGDDAVQVQGDRALLDFMWLGVDPTGDVIESPSTSREGVIVYGGSADLVVTNSRIAGFDSGIISNSGTIDVTITGTEIFNNRSGGIVFNGVGRITSLGNSIHDNVGLGIELGSIDGVPLPNDVGDGDTGANDLLNYPVLTGATVGAGTVDVDYTIDVPAGTYRIEFFDSDRPDPTGFGEGQTFLSAESIVHPGGSASYTATVIAAEGDVITATATPDLGGGTYGGTSEFSNTALVGIVFVNSTSDASDIALGDGVCDTGALNADGFTECTLRAAIEEANASVDVGAVHFQIPETDPGFAAGAWTITPATGLPFLSDLIAVDASTQPGWVDNPLVQLDGTLAPAATDGLSPGTGTTIRGLALTSWQTGIVIGFDNVAVEANWLGVGPDGTVAVNRQADAIVYGTTSNLTFGGPESSDGNVLAAGGTADGLVLSNTPSNVVVENNYFGVAADGITPLGGVVAEFLIITDDTSAVTVRDNQFVGSPNAAIIVTGNATDIDIVSNIFGTDVSGALDLAVAQALYAETTGTFRFGGSGAGEGNLVRNASTDAIVLSGAHTGTATVLGNSIAGSGNLALDIAADGPDTNDPGDTVPGPNGTLNYPEIVDVVGSGGFVTIRFGLDVAAGDYRIEAFANPSGADPTGYGEGEHFVGAVTVTHTGGGTQTFELDVASPAGAPISLTATVELGGGTFGPTSEFSSVATPVSAAVVEDISPRLTDVTAAGGLAPAVSVSGIGGDGINIDGAAERLVGPATDITSNELTMSAWVQLDAAGNDPRIISKGVGAGAIYELLIDNATGEAVARIDVGGSLVEARGGSVPTGSWHQIVATWTGSALTLYVDGVSVDTAAASGTLTADLDEPLVVGNNRSGAAGLNGTVDQVELRHSSMPAAEVLARFRNGSDPGAFVAIGGVQTAAPAPWTTSGSQSHTGGNALAAPPTTPGADAWITAIGIDEPGVELTAWWWVSDPTASDVSAGTRTGPNPTDQLDAAASSTGLDLGAIDAAVRTSAATDATTLTSGTWQQVVMSTDELGVTSFRLEGVTRLGPTSLMGLASGSVGFRVADIDPGQQWFIDDVRLRRLVSDEPTTSLGPIERN